MRKKKSFLNQLVNKFIRHYAKYLLILLFITPGLTACANSSSIPSPMPFPSAKAGAKIEIDFSIPKENNYLFSICFAYDKDDLLEHDRVKKLAGKYDEVDSGVSMQLHLKVAQIKDSLEIPIVNSFSSSQPMYTSSYYGFCKKILTVQLSPGDYKASIENLKDIPELFGTTVLFDLSATHHGK